MRVLAGLAAAVLALVPGAGAMAEPTAASLFSKVPGPSDQPSEPIGGYSRGCGAGMVQLPESGPTWQVMRLSRNRNWGQPELVHYLIDLSQKARAAGWRGIYVGDMSQPRGGPTNTDRFARYGTWPAPEGAGTGRRPSATCDQRPILHKCGLHANWHKMTG